MPAITIEELRNLSVPAQYACWKSAEALVKAHLCELKDAVNVEMEGKKDLSVEQATGIFSVEIPIPAQADFKVSYRKSYDLSSVPEVRQAKAELTAAEIIAKSQIEPTEAMVVSVKLT